MASSIGDGQEEKKKKRSDLRIVSVGLRVLEILGAGDLGKYGLDPRDIAKID
jgi:hypothetical protein